MVIERPIAPGEVRPYRGTYSGGPGAWRAVVKQGNRVVWESSETFKNRDETTSYARAAKEVSGNIACELNNPGAIEQKIASLQKAMRAGSNYAAGYADSIQFLRWVLEQVKVVNDGNEDRQTMKAMLSELYSTEEAARAAGPF